MLLSDPAKILQEEGLEVPPGVEIRVLEETENVRYLMLPLRPSSEELSEDLLTGAAGGRAYPSEQGDSYGGVCIISAPKRPPFSA